MTHVNFIDWHISPFRAERWAQIWTPALTIALAYGAESCVLVRAEDDPLHFRQISTWRSREDFERYWACDEVAELRVAAQPFYGKPVNPAWGTIVVDAARTGAPTA